MRGETKNSEYLTDFISDGKRAFTNGKKAPESDNAGVFKYSVLTFSSMGAQVLNVNIPCSK